LASTSSWDKHKQVNPGGIYTQTDRGDQNVITPLRGW